MSGLFPFISGDNVSNEVTIEKELPLLKEFAIDLKTGSPIVENKMFKTVTGVEALKVWIYRALKVERFIYDIYSWDFGNEMHTLIGKSYSHQLTKEEVKRFAKEAIEINPYITNCEIKEVTFRDSTISLKLKIETVYGNDEFEI